MKWCGMAPAHTDTEQSILRLKKWVFRGIHHSIGEKQRNKAIGYIVIKPDSEDGREDTRELGFALLPEYRHIGFMSETVRAVLQRLKADGIRYVRACCFKGNEASKSLIESCGFAFFGFGEYYAGGEKKTYKSLEYRIDFNSEEK